jgi:hypothetical protein
MFSSSRNGSQQTFIRDRGVRLSQSRVDDSEGGALYWSGALEG